MEKLSLLTSVIIFSVISIQTDGLLEAAAAAIPHRHAQEGSAAGGWFLPKYSVHIANGLHPADSSSPPLIAHCFSKDDDFGNHTITVNQEFYWNFHTVPGVYVTMFACHFWWGGNHNKAFEVFNERIRTHWSGDTGTNEPRRYFYIVNQDGFWVFKEVQDPPYDTDPEIRGAFKWETW